MCPDHKIIKRQNPCTFPSGHAAFQQKKKNYKWRTLRQLFRGRVVFNEQKYQEQNQSRGSVIPGIVKDLEKRKKVEKSSACSGNDNKFMWLQDRLQSQVLDRLGLQWSYGRTTAIYIDSIVGLQAGPQWYRWHQFWNQNTPGLSPGSTTSKLCYLHKLLNLTEAQFPQLRNEEGPSNSQGRYEN